MSNDGKIQNQSKRFLMDFKSLILNSAISLVPQHTPEIKSKYKNKVVINEKSIYFPFSAHAQAQAQEEKTAKAQSLLTEEDALSIKKKNHLHPMKSLDSKQVYKNDDSDNLFRTKKLIKISKIKELKKVRIESQKLSIALNSSIHPKSYSSSESAFNCVTQHNDKPKINPLILPNSKIIKENPISSHSNTQTSENDNKKFKSLQIYSNWLEYYSVSII